MRPANESGFVLVATLTILLLLSLIAIATMKGTHALSLGLRAERAQIARELALQGVLADLMHRLSQPNAPMADGTAFEVPLGIGTFTARVFAASGLISLKHSSPPLIEGLLVSLGAEPEVARRVTVELITRRQNPKAEATELVETLALAGEDVAKRAQLFLTNWSTVEMLDPSTAPVEVLRAIPGMTDAAALQIVSDRTAYGHSATWAAGIRQIYRPFLDAERGVVFHLWLEDSAQRGIWSAALIVAPIGKPARLLALAWPRSMDWRDRK